MKILWKLNWAAVLAVCINTSSADPAYWLKIDLKTALANFQLLRFLWNHQMSLPIVQCTMYMFLATERHHRYIQYLQNEPLWRLRSDFALVKWSLSNYKPTFFLPQYIPLLLTLNLSTFLGRCFIFHFILVDLICWILSLFTAIKGCLSEFGIFADEHFRVNRLLIKYWW